MGAVFLVSLFLGAACSTELHGKPNQQPKLIPKETPPDPRLTIEPYFAGSGAEEFAKGNWAAAEKKFKKAVAKQSEETKAKLSLLIAVCESKQGKWTQAATRFAALVEELPALSDYLHFNAARAFFFAKDRVTAEKQARAVQHGSAWSADASFLVGDILRGRSDQQATLSHYRDYVAKNPNGIRRPEAFYRIAVALETLGANKKKRTAAYEKVISEGSKTTWATKAKQKLDTKRPKRRRSKVSGVSSLAKGLDLLQAKQNKQAERELRRALASRELTNEQRCETQYNLGVSIWQQRRREDAVPVFDKAIKACKKAKLEDLHVKSAYQAGRTLVMLDKAKEAIARYGIIEEQYPENSYADDARVLAARQYRWLGEDKKADDLLATVSAKYPTGDMRSEAFWRLAWPAYKRGEYKTAEKWLQEQVRAVPLETHWSREGQALYWLARTRAKQGLTSAAFDTYLETIETYPLSYYALLALNRIRESNPIQYGHLVSSLGTSDALPSLYLDSMLADENVQRGIEFSKLGLKKEAKRQFTRGRITPPRHRKQVTEKEHADILRASAHMFYESGNFKDSHWILRWHALEFKRSWPHPGSRGTWRAAYPEAFRTEVKKSATKNGIPAGLLSAFMREESGFQPHLESWANAIGLTQLLIPTAKQYAKGTGIRVNSKTLREPAKNLTIGSRYMAHLMKRFSNHPALAIAAYNAGEGSVSKWLNERGDWPQDEFQEDIPFGEARGYSKRVLASYFAYSFLADGTVPVISQTLKPK